MLKIGSNDISALYIGNTEIMKAYLGSTIVYEKTPEPQVDAVKFTTIDDGMNIYIHAGEYHTMEYSYDGETWVTINPSADASLSIDSGDTLYVRGILTNDQNVAGDYSQFYIYGEPHTGVKMSGNINTLWDYTAEDLGSGFQLKDYCGYELFNGCQITNISELEMPSENLAIGCYSSMFDSCLIDGKTPVLPAETLVQSCYSMMFINNPNLYEVTCYAKDVSAASCTTQWLSGVANAGTFTQDANTAWESGENGIPEGWTSNYINGYITFTATVDSASIGLYSKHANHIVEYSYDGENWTEMTTATTISMDSGDTVMVRGEATGDTSTGTPTMFDIPINLNLGMGSVNVSGNINTMWNYKGTEPRHAGASLYLADLFEACGINDASGLLFPDVEMTRECYKDMFSDCYYLVKAPKILRSMSLAYDCYETMFSGCDNLVVAPELPATILAIGCYRGMFMGCNNLSYIKCLAYNVTIDNTNDWVYGVAASGTFVKKLGSSWTTGDSGIPTGWVTQYNDNAFVTFQALSDNSSIGLATKSTKQTLEYSMDKYIWSAMTTATTISMDSGDSVYVRGILSGDNSTGNTTNFNIQGNVKASGNINTIWGYNEANLGSGFTLYQYCGDKMFSGCTGLVDVTELELPAKTLSYWGYHQMFHSCTGLVTAPALPATTMAQGCYLSMFAYCTSLVNAPVLPATTLVNGCYYGMFNHCTSLLVSPTLKAATLVTNCYKEMFLGCTNLRHIECLATSGISTAVTQNWVSGVSANGTIQFSNEGFSTWSSGVSGYPTSGWFRYTDYIQMKSNGNSTIGLAKKGSKMGGFRVVKGDDWEIVTSEMTTATTINLSDGEFIRCWASLSSANTNSDYTQFAITGDVELSGNCNAMNNQISSTALKNYCFFRMFSGCSITSVSANFLPATALTTDCYTHMFRDCPNLKNAPFLPATTLKTACYGWMFQDCTSLKYAPTLSATTLVQDCYRGMFYNCTSLIWIKCLATSISASNCTYNWVYDAPASGTFVKKSSMSSWTTGTSGIPSGWTVQNV